MYLDSSRKWQECEVDDLFFVFRSSHSEIIFARRAKLCPDVSNKNRACVDDLRQLSLIKKTAYTLTKTPFP